MKLKPTEIDDTPEGWELRELGSLGQVITGKTPPTQDDDNFGKGYLFITPRDMLGQKYVRTTERYITEKGKGTIKNCLLPASSVCVSCIGSDMGKVIMTDRPSVTNQQLNSLVCEDADPHFVYYGIINIADRLRDAAFHSTAVPILNKSAFSQFEILIPRERSKQSTIAKILNDLDAKIELNHQMNKTLEAMAQALFKRWFVDFEFPGYEKVKFVNSLPEGWEERPLDQIAHFLNGLALQKYPPEGEAYLPAIKIRELNQGVTESSDKVSVNIEPTYIVDNGDVLFSWSGSLNVVLWGHGKGALNQHLFKVTSKVYSKWFYFFWVKYHLSNFQHIAEGKATTMGHIQRHHLSEALVLVPSKDILQTMTAIMEPMVDQIVNNLVEIRNLIQIRDFLLPMLMSGKIKVNE